MINIQIAGREYQFKSGITPADILKKIDQPDQEITVAALFNNQIIDLSVQIEEDCQLNFLTINDEIGNRIYRRGLFLILAKVIYELYPDGQLSIEHSLSNGIYCELHKDRPLSQLELTKIETRMYQIIRADLPIQRQELSIEALTDIFKKQGFFDKVKLINQLDLESYPVYELENFYDYFYYNMVPSTGCLNKFSLQFKMPGFILLYPQRGNPYQVPEFVEQPKLASIFQEYERWGEIIGVGGVSDLNQMIEIENAGELVRISEALHEKKIANIADRISEQIQAKRIILIAGPSSSGKTTFAQRLAIQLRVNGLRPVAISTDDYFVDRDLTPLDPRGEYDFEAIEAIDLNLFNEHLVKLLQGEEVEIPRYNFQKGSREPEGKFLQIEDDQPIIIEGIHGLNDRLTAIIPQENKFKIYISALTQLNLDSHNRIPTTDTRLIRRIVRDHHFRNHPAVKTIAYWPGVRRGEEKNIFPYQENADIMFNSALIYELAVLKRYAEPLLQGIGRENPIYYQAQRLLNFLRCFKTMPEDDVPKNSILKEFIGGSAFKS